MDFYILLGLEPGALANDVERAYRRLARRYHPNVNPGDRMAVSRFRQISEAYETLSDPDRRHLYDTGGLTPPQDAPVTVGFQGFDFSTRVGGALAPSFGDLFADILRRGPVVDAPPTEERGADLHHTLSLSFREAMHGGPRDVTITRLESCRGCRGRGRLGTAAERRCQSCLGTGSVQSARGHMVFARPCSHCGGTGRLSDTMCSACGGRQADLRTETLAVGVPAGLADGARIRIPGKGHAGRSGGAPGDLFIAIQVEADAYFRREGDDLLVVVPVAIHEAALGARIEVPAIDGTARVRVPPGTQSGQRFRLRERGAPSPRSGRRGDLVVEVRLMLPGVLDERSKALLREFGQINAADDVRRDLSVVTP